MTAEAPLLQAQSGERSSSSAPHKSRTCRSRTGNFAALAALSPGVNGTARIGGGGQTNFVMDGISVVDTGNNSQMLQLNVDAIAEVKVLTSNYQAEYGRSSGLQITAVTKSGTNRFHGSRLRRQAELGLEREQLGEHTERRPEDRLEAGRLGLHHRRSGRQAGRRQQAVLLLQPRVPAQRRAAVPSPDSGCRRHSSGTATSRRRATTPGRLFPFIRDSDDRLALRRNEHRRVLPGRRRASAASRRVDSTPLAWRS